jgi:heat shock protein HslJ
MSKDGTIKLSGANITIEASGPTTVLGNDVTLNP